MNSVDELFRKPNLPITSHKRKLEVPDADAAYKATKITSTSSPNGNANGNQASVDDEEDDDQEAGPDLPLDEDGDDEEGRFFGTGMSNDTSEALNYIDEQDGEEAYQEEKIDSAWLRRLCTTFEKKVKKNAELRARYEAEPAKFIDSEADLDAEIKSWSLLSEHSELYSEFAEAESAVSSLVGLLAHENTDIAIGAIEIVSELLDEDVQAEQEQWDKLVDALLEADLLELLMSNLARLDEQSETDRSGVYHSLAVLENLGGQQTIAEKIGQEKVLNWICERIGRPEKPLGQNKQYAAEVLQVLLQSSPILRKRLALDIDGVDLFLQVLAAYRKRDPPKDSHEEEYVENVFDALTCVVDEAEGKSKFVAAEGVELMLIMLKEGTKNISQRALRVLDHAVGGQSAEATAVCEAIIQAAGLKTMFSLFMKKSDHRTIEHLLGIFSALLRLLPGESAPRIRTLAKFSEKDHEKITRLLKLRKDYVAKFAAVDQVIEEERKALDAQEIEEREAEWFSRRLDGGLFCLQMVSVVTAWLIAEDPEIRRKVTADLGDLTSIRDSLKEQQAGLETEDEDTKEMLETLISFLW
ncbi:hypothetical protein DOTSEDRAFT_56095 [Dothistroma septosporum NZE10]|uniref:Beta-catenin-like protein 1 N-terminal domain-containing protein n=1 Tax=Dothistroma septosporum (strain NZE10 / CBS 128990) TaxID=675120 RepID=N1PG03_DOTSN|nr:hypothetical protein DOTSEDRAFT_56095 [Dothistroma septosporum NZE10]